MGSVSSQMRMLRRFLEMKKGDGEVGEWAEKTRNGEIPLVIAVSKVSKASGGAQSFTD